MDFRSTWVRALLLFLVLAIGMGAAIAATLDNLYITTVTITDRSDAGRERAFVQALGDVAVRVSGSRDAADRLGATLGSAKRYVQRFGYVAQDQLQVGFDPHAVDDLLTNAGLPIWGRERPTTLVWVQADDGTGTRRLITNSTLGPERDALLGTAQLRGLPISWATPASGLDAVLARQPSPGELDAERQRLGANALLIGFVSHAAPEPVVRWQFVFDGQVQDAAGSLESGIHLAADRLAAAFAAASGSTADVTVEVEGLADLDAYAQTLNYLEGLTLVRKVDVQEVRGQAVRFHVVSRGDTNTLRRALLLSGRLAPQPLEQSAPDPQHVRLVFQPGR